MTWNVSGLDSPEKRRMLLTHLHKQKAQVDFLQETHLTCVSAPFLKYRRHKTGYHSVSPNGKVKGVNILIVDSVPLAPLGESRDENGRLLFVKGHLGTHLVTMATVYALNRGQLSFL